MNVFMKEMRKTAHDKIHMKDFVSWIQYTYNKIYLPSSFYRNSFSVSLDEDQKSVALIQCIMKYTSAYAAQVKALFT